MEDVEVVEGPGFEPDESFDPRLPRRLAEGKQLKKRGAWEMRPYGLRVLNDRLMACDTDDDKKLKDMGRCGTVGSKFTIDGVSLYNPTTGTWTLPVKRWDEIRYRWTSEDAPFITVPAWKLPRDKDGVIDLSKISLLPPDFTKEAPGELMSTIEGSSSALLPFCAALSQPMKMLRRRPRRCNASRWQEQCQEFLCPADAH